MNFCKDCKYFKHGFWFTAEFALCKHPNNLDIVQGTTDRYCEIERIYGGKCGKAGILFEPKRNKKEN